MVRCYFEGRGEFGEWHVSCALRRFSRQGVVFDCCADDLFGARGPEEQLAGDPEIGDQAERVFCLAGHFFAAVLVDAFAAELLLDFVQQLMAVCPGQRTRDEDEEGLVRAEGGNFGLRFAVSDWADVASVPRATSTDTWQRLMPLRVALAVSPMRGLPSMYQGMPVD